MKCPTSELHAASLLALKIRKGYRSVIFPETQQAMSLELQDDDFMFPQKPSPDSSHAAAAQPQAVTHTESFQQLVSDLQEVIVLDSTAAAVVRLLTLCEALALPDIFAIEAVAHHLCLTKA